MTDERSPTGPAHESVDAGALNAAVEGICARYGKRHVGLVVGAVTSAGARSVVPVGRLRSPDGPATRADSIFEIGSVTKVFTALLLAEAVSRGEMSLDTPVGDLLPEVSVPTRDGVAITVEHLATHTAGLPNNPMQHRVGHRGWFDLSAGGPHPLDEIAGLLGIGSRPRVLLLDSGWVPVQAHRQGHGDVGGCSHLRIAGDSGTGTGRSGEGQRLVGVAQQPVSSALPDEQPRLVERT